MAVQETTTRFTYNMSWIVSAYINACILESTTAVERSPGARILVSFQYLIDELDRGWYTGHALLRSLQDLFTVRAGRRAVLALAYALPPPVPQTIDVDVRAGGGSGGGVIALRGQRRNDRNREVIPNPLAIQLLRILNGGNM